MRLPLLLLLFIVSSFSVNAALSAPAADGHAEIPISLQSQDLSRDAVEARLGRKLKLKERLGLSIVRGNLKRAERRAAKGKPAGGAPADGLAIASMVCGILGLFLFFPAIPAVVLGIISLGRFKRDPQYRTGKGMAIAGVILGGLVILAFIIILLIVLAFLGGL